MPTFNNKYRTESIRWQKWDYTWDGYYFITICTDKGRIFFGEVLKGEMILNNIGRIIEEEWLNTAIIRKGVILDEWVIMPNHMHAIIIFNRGINPVETPRRGVSNEAQPTNDPLTPPNVSKEFITPRRGVSNKAHRNNYDNDLMWLFERNKAKTNNCGWQSGSLGAIINQFKSVCTKRIRKDFSLTGFSWQSGYHDRVLRRREIERARKYITDNPMKWEIERNRGEGLYI